MQLGCLDVLLALLRCSPAAPGILNVSLKTLHVVFARGDACRDAGGRNPYATVFALCGGEADVAACRRHRCGLIATTATAMLDTYFDAHYTADEP